MNLSNNNHKNNDNNKNNNNDSSLNTYLNGKKLIDSDVEETEEDKVVEESPNGRWSKLARQICIQKLIDFDSANLGIDTDRGREIAWNEMTFYKSNFRVYQNRFDCVETLSNIFEKLKFILKFLIQLDHPNILKFYDFWYVDNLDEAKLVVITEYTAGGSLKKVLDSSKMSKTIIKPNTYKRWLNQILYSIKFLHNKNLSIFQGHLNAETIFMQNNGVIKLAPSLLSLNGICELNDSFLITLSRNEVKKKNNIDLIRTNNDIIIKDIRAIGRLAIEIFTAHIRRLKKSSASPSPRKTSVTGLMNTNKISSFNMLSNMILNENDDSNLFSHLPYLECLENELQKDFIIKCFHVDELPIISIESIWHHPFVNTIESLKVLSVFSIFNYFQDKRSNRSTALQKLNSINDKNDCLITTRNIINYHNLKSIDLEMDELFKKENYLSSSLLVNNNNNKDNSINSNNSYRITKSNSCNHLKSYSDRRISLSFLANFNHYNIPQHFFGILEDIRSGLYPRLFKENFNQQHLTRDIQLSSNCLDIVLQMMDKHSPGITNSSPFSLVNESNNVKYSYEERRVTWNECFLKNDLETDSKAIQLNLSLKFNDSLDRLLQCYIPNEIIDYIKFDLNNNFQDDMINLSENNRIGKICKGLTVELIDYGLINNRDYDSIVYLLMKSIKKYIIDCY